MPAPPQPAVLLWPLAHSSPPPPRASAHTSHLTLCTYSWHFPHHMKRNIWPSLTEHYIPWHYLGVSNHSEPHPQWCILYSSSPPVQLSPSLAPTPGSGSGGGCRPTEQQPETEASSRRLRRAAGETELRRVHGRRGCYTLGGHSETGQVTGCRSKFRRIVLYG